MRIITLKQQASTRSRALLRQAQEHFSTEMPEVEIRFNLRGQAAGVVGFFSDHKPVIRYNAQLLSENSAHFLATTIPHEVAHVVSRTLHGPSIRPHGAEWKAVMRFFGLEGKRCHNYDISRSKIRRIKRFDYHCACRLHQLSSIRHKRILAGQVYMCRQCGVELRPAG